MLCAPRTPGTCAWRPDGLNSDDPTPLAWMDGAAAECPPLHKGTRFSLCPYLCPPPGVASQSEAEPPQLCLGAACSPSGRAWPSRPPRKGCYLAGYSAALIRSTEPRVVPCVSLIFSSRAASYPAAVSPLVDCPHSRLCPLGPENICRSLFHIKAVNLCCVMSAAADPQVSPSCVWPQLMAFRGEPLPLAQHGLPSDAPVSAWHAV